MSADIAKKSPCKYCKHRKKDKEPVDSICYKCEKRVLYDLSLIDPRLIPKYASEDIERIDELKKVDILPQKYKTPELTYRINTSLKKQATNAGWNGDYISWLWDMHKKQKMNLAQIASKIKVHANVIRRRLISAGYEIINWQKKSEPIKLCEQCGQIMIRKRFPMGAIESRQAFSERRFCNRNCFAQYKKGE